MSKFGCIIKKIREDRKMSLRDVEEKSKLSNAYISQLERGIRGVPTLKTLKKLSIAYGMDEDALIKIAQNNDQDANIPVENVDFIARGYNKLDDEGKKQVRDFIDFLVNKRNES